MALLTHWDGEPVGVLERLWTVRRLEVHDRLGSTSDRVGELAREGAAPFAVVIAEEQLAGRGRSGRRWHSPPRVGLWMSVLLPGPAAGPHLPLLVGLAVSRSVEAVCPSVRVRIEWPNDIVVEGRKVGGVLCEAAGGGIVAGVGLNVRRPEELPPPDVVARATSLEAAGCGSVSRRALVRALIEELRAGCATPATRLLPAALAELTSRDALLDRAVWTEQAGEGTARGIEADGALVLERADRSRVRVIAGSVRPR